MKKTGSEIPSDEPEKNKAAAPAEPVERARLQADVAKQRVRIAKDRYAGEVLLLKDMLEAQSSLTETDYQYQMALTSYLTAQADFDKAAANK